MSTKIFEGLLQSAFLAYHWGNALFDTCSACSFCCVNWKFVLTCQWSWVGGISFVQKNVNHHQIWLGDNFEEQHVGEGMVLKNLNEEEYGLIDT